MTISISPRYGFTLWDSEDDQMQRSQFTANFSAIEALGAQCTEDVYANIPAPGEGQRFFYANDRRILYFDTGSAWQALLFFPDSEFTSIGRPAAGVDGRYVYETDTRRLFRDLGTNYLEIVTSTILPAGIILPTMAAVQPPGWLFCDGSAYAPGTYPDLYAAIGTRFGTSGGNFRVPDLRGVFLAGAPTLGATGGGQLGSHTHPQHDHATQIPFVDHVHEFFVQTLGSAVGETSPAIDPFHYPSGTLGGTHETETSNEVVTPASSNLLTYANASYLIKATGGPAD